MLDATIERVVGEPRGRPSALQEAIERARSPPGSSTPRAGRSSPRPQAPVRVALTGRTVGPAAVRVGRRASAATSRSPACGRRGPSCDGAADSLRLRVAGARCRRRSSSALVYLAVTFVQVWQASNRDEAARPPTPSSCSAPPSTTASRRRCSPAGSTTPPSCTRTASPRSSSSPAGGRPGDRFTEAGAGAAYLEDLGVPGDRIEREAHGREQLGVARRRPPASCGRTASPRSCSCRTRTTPCASTASPTSSASTPSVSPADTRRRPLGDAAAGDGRRRRRPHHRLRPPRPRRRPGGAG